VEAQVMRWKRQVEILQGKRHAIRDGKVVEIGSVARGSKALDIPSPPDARDFPYMGMFNGADPLPDKVMWTDDMPPLWDQGELGTCTSCIADLLDFFARKTGEYPKGRGVDSTGNDTGGLSHAFVYAEAKERDGIPDQEGSYNRVLCKVALDVGVCPEHMLPYEVARRVNGRIAIPARTAEMYEAAKPHRIKAYARVDYPNQGVDGARRALAEQGPLYLGILVAENFMDNKNTIEPPEGWIMGGHAVLLVGYDDSRRAFLMRNSWGPKWGLDGHKWMPYELWDWMTKDKLFPFMYDAHTLVDMDWAGPGDDHFTVPDLGAAYEVGTDRKWVNGVEGKCSAKTTAIEGRTRLLMRDVGGDLNAIFKEAGVGLSVAVNWDPKSELASWKVTKEG